jgi:hypothetical protein
MSKKLTVSISELAHEWDYEKNIGITPDDFTYGSNKKVWWLCKRGHSWQALISSRSRGKGCPYCNHRYVLEGFNDLMTGAPELAAEWDYDKNAPLRPELVMNTSHKIAWWTCEFGHSWQSTVANRRNGCGCPYCSGKQPIIGETDLKTLYPDLCLEWDYDRNQSLTPEQVTAHSQRKVWWICIKGHRFESVVSNRTRGTGCPYCAGKRPSNGETDFRTVHPELISEWDIEKNQGIHPEDFTACSHKRVWWLCEQGHSWQSPLYRRHAGKGCPYCSGLSAIRGETDLNSVLPCLSLEWDYERNGELAPDDFLPFSNKRVWWLCKNGHHWLSSIGARFSGSGCPYCHGKTPMRTRLVR